MILTFAAAPDSFPFFWVWGLDFSLAFLFGRFLRFGVDFWGGSVLFPFPFFFSSCRLPRSGDGGGLGNWVP